MHNKSRISSKLATLRRNHCSGKQIRGQEIIPNANGWLVKSSSSKTYQVAKKEPDCNDCKYICDYCKACIRAYSCTCPDSAIAWNMCKHIHAVLINYPMQSVSVCTTTNENNEELESLIVSVTQDTIPEENVAAEAEKLANEVGAAIT